MFWILVQGLGLLIKMSKNIWSEEILKWTKKHYPPCPNHLHTKYISKNHLPKCYILSYLQTYKIYKLVNRTIWKWLPTYIFIHIFLYYANSHWFAMDLYFLSIDNMAWYLRFENPESHYSNNVSHWVKTKSALFKNFDLHYVLQFPERRFRFRYFAQWVLKNCNK